MEDSLLDGSVQRSSELRQDSISMIVAPRVSEARRGQTGRETPSNPFPDAGESGEAYDAEIVAFGRSEGLGDIKSIQCPVCGQFFSRILNLERDEE